MTKNIRAAAAKVIAEILTKGASLSACLPPALKQFSDTRNQALLQALCYGVCRQYYFLEYILDTLVTRPLEAKDCDIFSLILVGLYQLTDMRIPAYAAVDDTVSATRELEKDWAKGLVNAVLREYQRQADSLQAAARETLKGQYSHPEWFINMLKKAWPTETEAILIANNEHPPFSLRVNQLQQTRESYLQQLTEQGITAQSIPETKAGITLAEPMDVERLPGFATGAVSVQDGAAQLAAELLDLAPGQRILDACAAPGGKTAHILEIEPALAELIAIDQDEQRLQSVTENLQRLQLTAVCVHSDAAAVKKWWDGQAFDRILLDAPCSASGVIRRHPDIKLLRRPEDVQKLVNQQLHLLKALWPCLKVGGLLLYVTCSILPRENSGVLKQFLAEHVDAAEDMIPAGWGQACPIGRQVLPGTHGMDGFYYARLRKLS